MYPILPQCSSKGWIELRSGIDEFGHILQADGLNVNDLKLFVSYLYKEGGCATIL